MLKKRLKRTVRYTKYIYYKETLVNREEKFWSFLGSFIGIGFIAFWQSFQFGGADNLFLIGSFGASSVLVYGAIESPLAQPRNLIGGHVIAAFIGVTIRLLLPDIVWLTAPLAVSTSIIAMQFTKTLHPPGGATALLAVIGSEKSNHSVIPMCCSRFLRVLWYCWWWHSSSIISQPTGAIRLTETIKSGSGNSCSCGNDCVRCF